MRRQSSSDDLAWQLMLESMRAGSARTGRAEKPKSAGSTKPPASWEETEPSPARHSRPVLRVVSSRRMPTIRKTSAGIRLVLIDGGKH